MTRRAVLLTGGAAAPGLGRPTPSRFPYPDRPDSAPGLGASSGQVLRVRKLIVAGPGGGTFVYSSNPPALGTLIGSDSAVAGTDNVGNAFLAGTAEYGQTGGIFFATVLGWSSGIPGASQAAVTFYTAPAAGGPWTQQSYIRGLSNGDMQFFSGSGRMHMQVPLVLDTASAPTLNVFGPSLYSVSGAAAAINISGLAGTFALTQSDTQILSNVNLAPITAISKAWSIPANDAQVGTKYEIVVPYTATMEGNNLQIGSGLNGAVFTNAVTIAGAIVAAGVGIRGAIRAWLKVKTLGAAGTADLFLDGSVQQTGAAVTFANSGSIPTQPATAVAINTTIANTLQVNSQWAALAAGQTISGYDSDFIRTGP